MELFIAFFLAVFAYMGYQAQLALLLFPCAIGSAVCFFIALRSFYWAIRDKLETKNENGKKHNKTVNDACGWTTLSVASPQGCPLPWR